MRTLPRTEGRAAELHVASLVARAAPGSMDAACRAIAGVCGAEVHAAEDGRIVVTLEAGSEQEVAQAMDAITVLPGVVSALLVYHHAEPLDSLEDPIP
ncbi:chaperone NapD [Arenibaculum pallidiluteum]|uniref:chaperone NapD n=1 Tax=Arenibaculum pallidiluteum TaxID=2812559 RepID=UPI001A96C268|nr:chaperone NapD [Arenibaculum pallidiluteum]